MCKSATPFFIGEDCESSTKEENVKERMPSMSGGAGVWSYRKLKTGRYVEDFVFCLDCEVKKQGLPYSF